MTRRVLASRTYADREYVSRVDRAEPTDAPPSSARAGRSSSIASSIRLSMAAEERARLAVRDALIRARYVAADHASRLVVRALSRLPSRDVVPDLVRGLASALCGTEEHARIAIAAYVRALEDHARGRWSAAGLFGTDARTVPARVEAAELEAHARAVRERVPEPSAIGGGW